MFPLPYQLRPMSPADIERVMLIEKESYPFPWTAGIFRDCLDSGYYACVLENGSEMAAYAVMSMGAGEAHVLNLCVRQAERGKGLGRALLHMLETVALANQVDMLLLEVRVSNKIAIKLYESMGFNEIGNRRNYYPDHSGREDALIMARQLL